MNFDEALAIVQSLLRKERKVLNSQMTDSLGRDMELFERVREYLIFNDLAEDKKGVGLIYMGPKEEKEPGPAVRADDEEGQSVASRETVEPEEATASVETIGERTGEEAGPAKSRKIFLSYGRNDAGELALKLYEGLRDLGHQVWFDKREIESGESWEEQIERGILGCEIFISLLSPHVVRRPEGVCLDEISMARYNSKRIIPTMVLQCRPPLGIYRLDWVDFNDWQQPARYEKAFRRLLSTIEREDACVEGTCARIFSTLRPLDFSLDICRLVRDFTGRRWLEDKLEHWLAEEESRVFFITGDPGTGKSAMIAHLMDRHPLVAAYHFCNFNLKDSLDPFIFVRSIAAQLATQLEGYRSALEAVELERIAEEDPGTLLRRLIADPLKGENPDKPVLLLVDALDEAWQAGERSIVKMLHERLEDLPPWIRLVLSSRKELPILDHFKKYHPHEIEADREENRKDIMEYLEKRLSEPALSALLSLNGVECGRLAELLSEKGKGNFLYVTQALDAIESGQINPHDPDSFPDGLVGMYHTFFERQFPDGKGFQEIRPNFDVIIAAREPLTAKQIGAFLKRSSFEIEREMERVAPYFPEREGKYSVYHKSVADWLKGEAGYSRTFRVDRESGHSLMAESLLSAYRSGDRSLFTLSHLPYHLTHSEQWDDLESVLCDLFFIDAKCAKGMTYDLVSDYRMALDALPDAQEERTREKEQKERIKRYTKEIIDYARKFNEARDSNTKDPQKSPLQKPEDIQLPEPPQSVESWPEKEIEKDSERIINNPTRLDRIQAFSRFVDSNIHSLAKYTSSYPGFCIQQAYNSARSGPVAKASEVIFPKGVNSLLLKQNPRPFYNPYPVLLKTLEGHTGSVYSVSVVPDGTIAVSGSSDKTLRVWDIESGECSKMLTGHTGSINCTSITPDGTIAVSGSSDKTLRVWDIKKGVCSKTLNGHTDSITCVSVTADGKRAVSGSEDTTLRIWNIESGECSETLEGHTGWIYSVSITADGKKAISGSRDKTLRLWDLERGECSKTIERNEGSVYTVSISPDGKRAIIGSWDYILRVLDIENCTWIMKMKGHTRDVTSVSITPDSKRAVSGSYDKTLKIWNLERGECSKTLEGHTRNVNSVCITADGKRAVSCSADKTLKVWDIGRACCCEALEGHTHYCNMVNITADGKRAVSVNDDDMVRIWDIETGECTKTLEGHTDSIKSMKITPDGKKVITGSRDTTLCIWNIETGKCIHTLEGHASSVHSMCITPDGKRVISGSGDSALRIWDIESGEYIKSLEGHTSSINTVDITPDGRRVVSKSDTRVLLIWDLESNECLNSIEGYIKSIDRISITPDGMKVVSGCFDNTLRVWDIESGGCYKMFEGHTDQIWSLSIIPDGKRIVSAGEDKTLRIWDLESGELYKTLEGHTDSVRCVRITPDGKRAISGSYDATLRVWDLESGECLSIYQTKSGVRFITEIEMNGFFILCLEDGKVNFITPYNLPLFSPIITPWQSQSGLNAFGCPLCRIWSEIPESVIGSEIPCPNCNTHVKLNPFIIEADWHPVVESWKGE